MPWHSSSVSGLFGKDSDALSFFAFDDCSLGLLKVVEDLVGLLPDAPEVVAVSLDFLLVLFPD